MAQTAAILLSQMDLDVQYVHLLSYRNCTIFTILSEAVKR